MTRPCHVSVDSDALAHNLQVIKQKAAGAKVMAVIKSDAYGHGLLTAAKSFKAADALAVTSTDEAMLCRQAGITTPLLMLSGYFDADELPMLAEHNIWPLIHNTEHCLQLASYDGPPLTVWVKVNLSMNRLGFTLNELHGVVQQLSHHPKITIKGILGHLSHAFDRDSHITKQDIADFRHATDGLNLERSLANSAGLLAWPDSHFDWVRPGVSLYGLSPFAYPSIGAEFGLKPAMTFSASIMGLRKIPKGSGLGYGWRWKAPADTTIGLISCGYGDGYPRHIPDNTPVLVAGHKVPLVGRVSMDMITVDLSHHPQVQLNDEVTLWGPALPVETIANHYQTIGYELCCQAGRTQLRQTLLARHKKSTPGVLFKTEK